MLHISVCLTWIGRHHWKVKEHYTCGHNKDEIHSFFLPSHKGLSFFFLFTRLEQWQNSISLHNISHNMFPLKYLYHSLFFLHYIAACIYLWCTGFYHILSIWNVWALRVHVVRSIKGTWYSILNTFGYVKKMLNTP